MLSPRAWVLVVVAVQVGHLLASLHINPADLPSDMAHVHDAKWHEAWAQSQQQGALDSIFWCDCFHQSVIVALCMIS